MIFVACDDDQPCEIHADENTDAVCDSCGETLEQTTTTETEEETTTQEETLPVCEEHKDEDADKICDVCTRAIVVMTEQIAPEEESRVDMIVNGIPTAELKEYVNTAIEEGKLPTGATAIDGFVAQNGIYVEVKLLSEDGTFNTYKLYDVLTDRVVCSDTDKYTGALGGYKTVDIEMTNNYVVMTSVSITPMNDGLGSTLESRSVKLYTYGGENFCTMDWTSTNADGKRFEEMFDFNAYEHSGLEYIKVNENVYVLDPDTKELVHEDNDKTLVHRPEMDMVVGDLGYRFIYDEDMWGGSTLTKIYVYDLTKWIECIYSYFVPSYYENVNCFVLNNGNVLVQGELALSSTAVSYDYIQYGSKYDLVYTMIDARAKSEKEIEFGYYINDAYDVESAEILTGKAINAAEVYPIENDRVNYSRPLVLLVDNDMKVLYDCNSSIDLLSCDLVADGLFLHTISEDDYYVRETVNEKGERVAYIPYNASCHANWVVYEGKLYDYTMKLLFDPAKSGYTVLDGNYAMSYMILTKVNEATELVEYYYYTAPATAPIKIEGATAITYYADRGFQITRSVEQEDGSFKTVYSYYGEDNVKLFDAETFMVGVSDVGADAYIVTLFDGSHYIVK
jgi:hypothetical protein